MSARLGRIAPLLALVSIAGIVVFAVGSVSAATTSKPYRAIFEPIPPATVAGGSIATITLTLTNLASPQTLGSANVTAPSGFTITGATPTQYIDATQTYPAVPPNPLKLRNLGISPGTQRTITITTTAPCGPGDYTWGIRAKQSNDFSGPPGNDFTHPPAAGSNLVTRVVGSCRLEWVTQPASTNPNAVITGTAYTPSAAKVAVKAVDGLGNTLTSVNTGTATLVTTAGTVTSSGGFAGTEAAFSAGVATFSSLASSATGYDFKLRAQASGFTDSPESGTFDIFTGTLCTTSGCQTPALTHDETVGQAQTSSSNFVFLGIGTLNGTKCIVPSFDSVQEGEDAAPIVVTEKRTSLAGELYVTYGIKKAAIQKRYGNTSGEQFLPICAGSKRLRLNGGTTEAVPCGALYEGTQQNGWKGKELNAEGKFSGDVDTADCDPTSGYFVGILGSFQDYTSSDPAKRIDPSTNPTVVGWNSDNTYRYFTIRFPSSSGTGVFAGKPWDGWQFG